MPSNCVPENARWGSAMTSASQPRFGFFKSWRMREASGRRSHGRLRLLSMSWYVVTISPWGATRRAATSVCQRRLSAGACRSSVEVRALSANRITLPHVFWWSRKVRTMRARTAATFGVTWGALSAMNRIGSRWSEPDDGRPPTVPRGASANGGVPFMIAASFAAYGALRALLFQKQLLDEVQEAGSNDEPTASDFDALDHLGHDQLIGPRPAHPEDVGHLFYREQQLGVHLHRVSFIGQGGASTLCSGLGHGCA